MSAALPAGVAKIVIDCPIGDPSIPEGAWPEKYRLAGVWPRRISADEILREIDRAQATCRVLLLVVHRTPGGDVAESGAIYDRVRDFSRAGGTVIAHVSGLVGSSAPVIAGAADWLVVDAGARIALHSASAHAADGSSEPLPAVNEWIADVVAARSAVDRSQVAEWLRLTSAATGPEFVELDADAARAGALADCAGTIEIARALAEHVARGGELPITTRRGLLLARPEPKAWRDLQLAAPGAIGALQTSNYSESAGNPTAGAKLDHVGTALKVAPANVQIGRVTLDQTWFARTWSAVAKINLHGAPGNLVADLVSGFNFDSSSFDNGSGQITMHIPAANNPPQSAPNFMCLCIGAAAATVTPLNFYLLSATADGSGGWNLVFAPVTNPPQTGTYMVLVFAGASAHW